MSDDLRARIDTLFDRALDLPPEERLPFVRAAAAGDPEIERGVVELLRLASGPESDDDWSGASESLWMELVTELESPAPTGTVLSTYRSSPGTAWPASRRAHTTPATYAAQPVSDPGPRSATDPVHSSSCCALTTCRTSSARGRAATYVAWGSATGRTRPPL